MPIRPRHYAFEAYIGRVELRTLRYLVAVADHGSVSAAAHALHLTQPALSRQVKALERSLGLVLFDRNGPRLVPTAAGRQFLPEARAVLECAGAARRLAASLAVGRLSILEIAAPATTLTDVVSPFLATFGPSDPVPGVTTLEFGSGTEVLSRGVDLVVLTAAPPAGLAWRALAVLNLWASVPRDDPFAGRASVDLAELVARPLLLLPAASRPRQILTDALAAAGLAVTTALECAQPQVAQALAAAGRGVAVVSDDPRFDLVGVPVVGGDGPLCIELHAAWDPTHHAAATLAWVAARLGDFCVDRYGQQAAPSTERPAR